MIGRDASLTAVIQSAPEASALYTPFKDMAGVDAAEQARLRAAALRSFVTPCSRRMRTAAVHAQRNICRTCAHARCRDLPDGEAYYRAKIVEFTSLRWDPADIHALGSGSGAPARRDGIGDEGDRFHGRFRRFLEVSALPIRRFYAKTPEELLMRAAWIAKEFDGKAAQLFRLLPRGRFAIRPVPADIAPFYTAGRGGRGSISSIPTSCRRGRSTI